MKKILKKLSAEIRQEEIPESKSFLKWLIIGSVSGVIIGLIGTLFHFCSSSGEFFRSEHQWIIFLLPVSGLAITFLYHFLSYSHDKGTNLVLLAVRDNTNMGFRHAASIFAAAVITHIFGGSSGREGASLQIGASIGSYCGRHLGFDDDDRRIMTMCCMSAMFAAVFGTPVTAALFSMEVISVGIFYYSAIVPCVVSALIASYISSFFGISHISADVIFPEISPVNYLKTILLGVLCAALSWIFCISMVYGLKTFRKIKNHYIRVFVGGSAVVLLTLFVGNQDYNGTGGEMIVSAFTERPFAAAFLIKLIFTVITLCSGFKGGEIFPVFFIGATFGSVISRFIGVDCSFGAAICMAALFCGVTNCPIASILLSVELFGGESIIYCVLACAVSYMISGYRGLYSEQKILYSKIKTRYINKRIGDKK